MTDKTQGIVLQQIKYSDSGIIIQVYTKRIGRLSFLIKGMRNKKSGKHNVLFQPLFILDIVFYYKASREIQLIKEFTPVFIPYDIHYDIIKRCIAIFLGEVLSSVLKEQSPHEEMYDYIEGSILFLNGSGERYSNFHIAFLCGLSRFLGFEPGKKGKDDKYFDMINGRFVRTPPSHSQYADKEVSAILGDFFKLSYQDAGNISLSGRVRNLVLDTLVQYYSTHLPGLKKINSLTVLKDVFA